MLKATIVHVSAIALALLLSGFSSSPAGAEDVFEKTGIAAGVTGGNMVFLPAKAVSVSMGALTGALSLLLTGNMDLAKQIWQDTTQGPYLIDPDVAKKAVGDRPELSKKD